MRYRLSDVLRDTVVYETLDDMYEGLRFMDEELLNPEPLKVWGLGFRVFFGRLPLGWCRG